MQLCQEIVETVSGVVEVVEIEDMIDINGDTFLQEFSY